MRRQPAPAHPPPLGKVQTMLSVAESADRGKQLRRETPRSAHAVFEPAADRPDPVAVLEKQAETRVPELVPIRYGRMLSSPFAFFRGAAAIMAGDLSATPRTGIDVQSCGDAHLSNFGVFASPERRLVFDLNDFDETLPGPWEWDVKRLATSILIAAQSNGFGKGEQERMVLDTVGTYRTAMATFAAMHILDVWYASLDIDAVVNEFASQFKPKTVKRTEKGLAKARTRDSMSAFSKLTHIVDGQPRIVDESPLIVPIDKVSEPDEREEIVAALSGMLRTYVRTLPAERQRLVEQFELADFARKVVGVGSVGTRTWIALMLGPDGKEPLFLQIKQAEASVLEPVTKGSQFTNHGERVVVGQRLMQASSDIFLGWLRVMPDTPQQADYYVRQLRDWKGSAEIDQMRSTGMAAYGRLCGWTLARAHARTGDRVAIASYLGGGERFDRAILEFARAYAEQNERDYAAVSEAVKAGRITAETGV
jgi:uncharacterized protein (DUF2252 family)